MSYNRLKEQRTNVPTRKVRGAGFAGALSVVVIAVLGAIGVDVNEVIINFGENNFNLQQLIVLASTLVGGFLTKSEADE